MPTELKMQCRIPFFGIRHFLYFLKHTFLKTSNPNQNIDALESDYLYIETSQIPDSGKGLFTAIPIYKGETIALFKGEILSKPEAKNRAKAGNDLYFINMPEGNIMDSMHVMCFAKFANDATGALGSRFKNNTHIVLNDEGQVCIQALRQIKANEEIFCSYGKKYWDKHSAQSIGS